MAAITRATINSTSEKPRERRAPRAFTTSKSIRNVVSGMGSRLLCIESGDPQRVRDRPALRFLRIEIQAAVHRIGRGGRWRDSLPDHGDRVDSRAGKRDTLAVFELGCSVVLDAAAGADHRARALCAASGVARAANRYFRRAVQLV